VAALISGSRLRAAPVFNKNHFGFYGFSVFHRPADLKGLLITRTQITMRSHTIQRILT
jgi:hypothetical protein